MALKKLEIIRKGGVTYGHLDGFLYNGSDSKGDVKYWKCRNRSQCSARLTTVNMGRNVIVRKGGTAESHINHGPDPEAVKALRILGNIKRQAQEHHERPPTAVLRETHNADEAVQARLPEIENLRRGIQRERLRFLPTNPTNIEDLQDVPDSFNTTLVGDKFLLYDSISEERALDCGRILIFATRENLRLLFRSDTWFLDGTFDTVPKIFFQLFTIMGSIIQTHKGTERKFALPFVYALLQNKQESAYEKVLQVVVSEAVKTGIQIQRPQTIMTDFELAIINAIKKHYSEDTIHLCLFHLCQSVYRRIQAEGLQRRYGDPNDASIRQAAHSMCALAFVPIDKVSDVFDILLDEIPEEFIPIASYFETTYIRGVRARGRRKPIRVRYAPSLWNHYNSTLSGTARTNNASEGWHNRFQLLVGRKHPGMYSFFKDLQKEQAAVEYMLRELSLEKKIKKMPRSNFLEVEERIKKIVNKWQEYVDEDKELTYIKTLGLYLHM